MKNKYIKTGDMKTGAALLFFMLLFFFITPWVHIAAAQQQGATITGSSKILADIIEEYWQFQLKESPFLRLKQGLKIEELPDSTWKRAEYHAAAARSLLEKLQAVKETEISSAESLSLHILKWELEGGIEGHKYFYFYFPITPYASPFPYIDRFFVQYRFKTQEDLDNYIQLLKQYPGFIANIIDLLKRQYQDKYIIPKVELNMVLPYFELTVQQADKSPLYVGIDRLHGLPENQVAEFEKKIAGVIEGEINPAFKRLVEFIKGDYYKNAPENVGLYQYTGGKEYYKYLVKQYTTLDLTPEQVHQTGLDEVERLHGELDKIREEVKFNGDRLAFLAFLKNDPRFKPQKPEDIGDKLIFFLDRVKTKIDSYFSKKPKAPCGVKRLDAALEAAMTFGYYQEPTPLEPRGTYFYNGSQLAERSLLDSAALILHELVPGHHFQIALQNENQALPAFRRENFQGAYIEGWAQYAAQLGLEMGIYENPYDRCGLIMQDMMMAVRLVVDTGMNYFGWSRDKAAAFMKENTILSAAEIATETLRFSVDIPGQALSYKIGGLTMERLRKKAEQVLGDKFDIREFHEALLGSGSLPFTVLERHIDRFIAAEKEKQNQPAK